MTSKPYLIPILVILTVLALATAIAGPQGRDLKRDERIRDEETVTDVSRNPCCCWTVDDYNCANLDPATTGNHAWWCGAYFPSCGSGDPVGGYGNDWDCKLDKFIVAPDPSRAITVRVVAKVNHDMEPNYDYLTLEYLNPLGTILLREFTGTAGGLLVDESFTVLPGEYVGPNEDEVHIRWHFVSDASTSDEDCYLPSGGAVQLDSILVYCDQGAGMVLVSNESNEGLTNEWFDPDCPGVSYIQGTKWEDLNCNGIRDPGEAGLADWEIRLYLGGTLVATRYTDANGDYFFCDIPPGTYRIAEIQSPTMIQTYPLTVYHTIVYAGTTSLTGLDFGNTACVPVMTCVDSCIGGRIDDFLTTDGDEATTVTPELDQFITSCSAGPFYRFDSIPDNACFGYSFSDSCSPCWQNALNGCVSGAWLVTRLRAGVGQTETDDLSFREDGVGVWGITMNDLQAWRTGGADNSWSDHDTNTFILDLADLPRMVNGGNNILATLQDGDLDFVVSDDTGVDYVKLIIEVCSSAEVGSIHGTKFNDRNCNEVRDEGEGGLEGWEIRLYQGATVSQTTLTNDEGRYFLLRRAPRVLPGHRGGR